jgi:ABC-2 type transport system ATP-binding protein
VLEDLILSAKARGATVVFSTHVMQHAERLCDRLVVIAQGQARFEGTPQEARALLPTRLRVVATMPLAWATQQSQTQAGLFVNEVALNTRAELDGLLKALASSGAHVHDLSVLEPSLHAVFVHLVGALMPETSMATSPALKTHSPSHTSELPA